MTHGKIGTVDDAGYIHPPISVFNLMLALIDDDAVSEIYGTIKASLYMWLAGSQRIESRHTSGGWDEVSIIIVIFGLILKKIVNSIWLPDEILTAQKGNDELSQISAGPRGENSAGWGDDDGGRTERVMGETAGVHFERVLSAPSGSMSSVPVLCRQSGEVENDVWFLGQKRIFDERVSWIPGLGGDEH
ncbi:hypothetical protein B0H19DRAFT_1084872 [Mycena capillaripes]|nr:hypothetical protein B0H19DRAFT_1084872 [Mycena capillaripes]